MVITLVGCPSVVDMRDAIKTGDQVALATIDAVRLTAIVKEEPREGIFSIMTTEFGPVKVERNTGNYPVLSDSLA